MKLRQYLILLILCGPGWAAVAARADEADAERTVGLAVARSFYETLANQERVRLAEQGVQISRELLDLAQRRLDAGVGTPLELNAAIVRFAEARRAALVDPVESMRVE